MRSAMPVMAGALGEIPIRRESELRALWNRLREGRVILKAVSFKAFKTFVLRETRLKRVHVPLPHRPETRYVWGEVSPLALALSLKPASYLTHFSAMAFHELTPQVPKTIYVNVEQRPQVSNPLSLSQEGIDRAFRRPQRVTTNTAVHEGIRFVIINGKHTGQLGVIDAELATGERIRVTSIERTLIDIAVRPAYSGGVARVLEAYGNALPRLNPKALSQTLTTMGYVYPYHQAIGFYLERAGAAPKTLALFREQPMDFDFYLAHGMREVEFLEPWRLWVPKGL